MRNNSLYRIEVSGMANPNDFYKPLSQIEVAGMANPTGRNDPRSKNIGKVGLFVLYFFLLIIWFVSGGLVYLAPLLTFNFLNSLFGFSIMCWVMLPINLGFWLFSKSKFAAYFFATNMVAWILFTSWMWIVFDSF